VLASAPSAGPTFVKALDKIAIQNFAVSRSASKNRLRDHELQAM